MSDTRGQANRRRDFGKWRRTIWMGAAALAIVLVFAAAPLYAAADTTTTTSSSGSSGTTSSSSSSTTTMPDQELEDFLMFAQSLIADYNLTFANRRQFEFFLEIAYFLYMLEKSDTQTGGTPPPTASTTTSSPKIP